MIVGMGGTALFWLQQQYTQRRAKIDQQEIWTINSGCFALQAHYNFSMHSESTMGGKFHEGDYSRADIGNDLVEEDWITQQVKAGNFAKLHQEYMKTGIPLVTPDGVDGALQYPLVEVVEYCQSYYFTNTPAYMIALAMARKAKIISLFGVDFDYGDPRGAYEAGKPCVEYWIGRAQARNIDIRLPAMTNLMSVRTLQQKGLYGYGYEQPEFEFDSAGRIVVKGFKSNPPPRSGDESLAAIPLNGGGNNRNGADGNVLAPAGVHRPGQAAGGVDDQFGLPGTQSQLELFNAYQSGNGGDGAGRGYQDRATPDAGQSPGPSQDAAPPRLQ